MGRSENTDFVYRTAKLPCFASPLLTVSTSSLPARPTQTMCVGSFVAIALPTGGVALLSSLSDYTLYGRRKCKGVVKCRGYAPVESIAARGDRLAVCHLWASKVPIWRILGDKVELERQLKVPDSTALFSVAWSSRGLVGLGLSGKVLVWRQGEPKVLARYTPAPEAMAVVHVGKRECAALLWGRRLIDLIDLESGESVVTLQVNVVARSICSVGSTLVLGHKRGGVSWVDLQNRVVTTLHADKRSAPQLQPVGAGLLIRWPGFSPQLWISSSKGWRPVNWEDVGPFANQLIASSVGDKVELLQVLRPPSKLRCSTERVRLGHRRTSSSGPVLIGA